MHAEVLSDGWFNCCSHHTNRWKHFRAGGTCALISSCLPHTSLITFKWVLHSGMNWFTSMNVCGYTCYGRHMEVRGQELVLSYHVSSRYGTLTHWTISTALYGFFLKKISKYIDEHRKKCQLFLYHHKIMMNFEL